MKQAMAGAGGGGAPPGGAPPMPGAPPGAPPGGGNAQPNQPPNASPMSRPQNKQGLKAAAQTNVHIAINMLEEALPAFGSESKEGKVILEMLKKGSSLMGERDSSDLVPAEILQMVRRLPQMGGGTGVQQQIQKQMQAQQPPPQAG
jgi:hypothetical protein